MAADISDVVFCRNHVFIPDPDAANHPLIIVRKERNYLLGFVRTDAANSSKFPNTMLFDYSFAGLIKPSIAICIKVLKFPVSVVTRVIGSVRIYDFELIRAESIGCGGINHVKEYGLLKEELL